MVRLLDGSEPEAEASWGGTWTTGFDGSMLNGTSFFEQEAPLKRRRSLNESSLSRSNSRSRTPVTTPRQDHPMSRSSSAQATGHSRPSVVGEEEEDIRPHVESAISTLSPSTVTAPKTPSKTNSRTGGQTPEFRARSKSPHPRPRRAQSLSWDNPSQPRRRSSGTTTSRQSPVEEEATVYQEELLKNALRDSSPEPLQRRRPRSKSTHPLRPSATRSFQGVESPRLSNYQPRRARSPTRTPVAKPKPILMNALDEQTKSPESKSKSRMKEMMRSLSPMNIRRNRSKSCTDDYTFDASTWATSPSLKNPAIDVLHVDAVETEQLNKARTPMSHALKASRSESNLARKQRQGPKRSNSFHRMRSDPIKQGFYDLNPFLPSSSIEQMSNLSMLAKDSLRCEDLAKVGSGTNSSGVTGIDTNYEDDSSGEERLRSDSEQDADESETNESGESDTDYTHDESVTYSGTGSPSSRRSRKSMGASKSSKFRRSKHSVGTASYSSKIRHKSTRVDALLPTTHAQGVGESLIQDRAVDRLVHNRNDPHGRVTHSKRREHYVLDTGKSWKAEFLKRFSRGLRSPRRTTQEINVKEDTVKHFGELREKPFTRDNVSKGGIVRTTTNLVEEEPEPGQQRVTTRTNKPWGLETNGKTPQSILQKKCTTPARIPLRKSTTPKDITSRNENPTINATAEPRRTALQSPRNQTNRVQRDSAPASVTNQRRTSSPSQMCYVRLTPLYLSGVTTEKRRWKNLKGTENMLVHGVVAHVQENGEIESPASLALSQPITPKVDSGKSSSYCLVWSNLNASDSTRGRIYISMPFHEDGMPGDPSRAAPDQEIVIGIKRGQEMIQLGYAHIPIFNKSVSGLDVEIEIVPFENTKKKGIFSKRRDGFENDDKVYSLENVAILRATLDIKRSPRISLTSGGHGNTAVDTIGGNAVMKEGTDVAKEEQVETKDLPRDSSVAACMDRDDDSRNTKDASPEIIRVPSTLPGSKPKKDHHSPASPSAWDDLGMTQMLSGMMTWNNESVPKPRSMVSTHKFEEESSLRTNDESLLTNEISSKSYALSIMAKKDTCCDSVLDLNKDETRDNVTPLHLPRNESQDWYPSDGEDANHAETQRTTMPKETIRMPSKGTWSKERSSERLGESEGNKILHTTTATSREGISKKPEKAVKKGKEEVKGTTSDLDTRILASDSSWTEDDIEHMGISPKSQLREKEAERHRSSSIPAQLPGKSRTKSPVPKKQLSSRHEHPNDQISVDPGYGDIVTLESFIRMFTGGVQSLNSAIASGGPRLATQRRSTGGNNKKEDAANRQIEGSDNPSATIDKATFPRPVELSTSANDSVLRASKSMPQIMEKEGESVVYIREMPTGCSALDNLSFTEFNDHSESGDKRNDSFESFVSNQDRDTQGSSVGDGNLMAQISSPKRRHPSRGRPLFRKGDEHTRNAQPHGGSQPRGKSQPHKEVKHKYKKQLRRRPQSQGRPYAKVKQVEEQNDESMVQLAIELEQAQAAAKNALKVQKLQIEGMFLEQQLSLGSTTKSSDLSQRASDVSSKKSNTSRSLGAKPSDLSSKRSNATSVETVPKMPSRNKAPETLVESHSKEMVDAYEQEDNPLAVNHKDGADSLSWNTPLSSKLSASSREEEILLTVLNDESFAVSDNTLTEQEDLTVPNNTEKKEKVNFRSKSPKTKPRPENHLGPRKKVASPKKSQKPVIKSQNAVPDAEPNTKIHPRDISKHTKGTRVPSTEMGADVDESQEQETDGTTNFQNVGTRNGQSRSQQNKKDSMRFGTMEGSSEDLEVIRDIPGYPGLGGIDRPPSSIDNLLASFDSSTTSQHFEADCLGDTVESVFASIFGPDERRILRDGYRKERVDQQRDDDAFIDRFSHLRDVARPSIKDNVAVSRTLPEDHWRHGQESPTKRIKKGLDAVPLSRQDSESSNLHLLQPPRLRRSISDPKNQHSMSDEKSLPYEEGFEMILHNEQETTKGKTKATKSRNAAKSFSQNAQNDRTLQTRYGLSARAPLGSSRVGRYYNDSKFEPLNSDAHLQSKTPLAGNTAKSILRRKRREEQDQLQNLGEGPESLDSLSFDFSETGNDPTPPGSENRDYTKVLPQPIDNPTSPDIIDDLIGPSARNKRDFGFKKPRQKKEKSRSLNKKNRDENVVETNNGAESSSEKREDVTIKLYQISKKLGLTPEALLKQLESGEDIGILLH
eukprot:scaffold2411_cov156-Amphora_coffeaeformis.AAC.1